MKITASIVFCVTALSATIFAQGLPSLASANDSFAFNLLGQIAKAEPNKNIFISPFSVLAVLQMVANGAAGDTKSEMLSVLQTAAIPTNELNAAYKKLNQSLAAPRDTTLTLANSIWYQKEIPLKSEFIDVNKNYFGAELAGVDFNNPDSAKTINDWADKNTRGKIQNVVQFPFPPLTRVVLADAIYFKGKWQTAFDKRETYPQDFHLANGDSKQVPMMNRRDKFNYAETVDYQAVQLPYRGGLWMELFLPTTNANPQKLISEFADKDSWQKTVQSGFSQREGFVELPKFKMNYKVELNNPLEALGMKRAFDARAADFSGMSTKQLFISAVKQKSYVTVDEEGTEAAAVTTTRMKAAGIPRFENYFRMILDRPFLFVITDDATQTILFMGIVNDPSK